MIVKPPVLTCIAAQTNCSEKVMQPTCAVVHLLRGDQSSTTTWRQPSHETFWGNSSCVPLDAMQLCLQNMSRNYYKASKKPAIFERPTQTPQSQAHSLSTLFTSHRRFTFAFASIAAQSIRCRRCLACSQLASLAMRVHTPPCNRFALLRPSNTPISFPLSHPPSLSSTSLPCISLLASTATVVQLFIPHLIETTSN